MRLFLMLAAVIMALGVGAGAFGAHALADLLERTGRLDTYETAVRYQMYHGLGLLAVAVLMGVREPAVLLTWSGWLFIVGTLIFSGSLYLLVGTGVRWLGAITPIGGVAFIAGWICLFVYAWRS